MRKLFWRNSIFFFLFLNQILLIGQNLVFNSDLSIVDSCDVPLPYGDIALAPYYFNPTLASPDLFNPCFPSSLGVPSNYIGFMLPKAGSGYLGFGINGAASYFEYISCKLIAPLKSGYIYCITFYIARASGNEGCMDQIGASLTVNKYNHPSTDRIVTANFITTPKGQYYCDVAKWEKIELEYQAKGGEQYLTIGQFLPFEEVVFGGIVPPYYYVDAFSALECAPPPVPQISLPNVFSPNQDGVNDTYTIEITGTQTATTQIFNRWGSVVFESTELEPVWDGMFNGNLVADGVYFVVVQATGIGGTQKTETQTVHVVK